VHEVRADIGIALDGDADRCLLVSEKGELVDGDMMLAFCTRDLVERGLLRGGKIVATVMSNLGLEKSLDALGVGLLRTQVGDRYVVETMRAGDYNLGGEQSGHIIFLDHNTSGDGLITALQTLAIMRRKERMLSELTADFERFPRRAGRREEADREPSSRDGGSREGRGRARRSRPRVDPLQRDRAQGADHGRG
jgi:phosphoglucosamine mutase